MIEREWDNVCLKEKIEYYLVFDYFCASLLNI